MAYFPPTGSVVAYQGLPSSMLVGASIIGLTPVTVSNPVSVLAVTQSGTRITSVISSTPSSMLTGASIFGMLPAGSQVIGSVTTLQGTNPWAITPVGSIAVQWQSPSIVGTYAEDATHTTADKGLFVLGVRNDAVASFVSADLEYVPHARDSAGRVLSKPFAAEEARIEGYVTTTNTSITTLVAGAGTGLRNYITDIWIANTGSVATLVTFSSGGGASILGYTIAPAGGGSNLPGLTTPIRTGVNETFGIQAASPTSILYGTVKGFKAP